METSGGLTVQEPNQKPEHHQVKFETGPLLDHPVSLSSASCHLSTVESL